MVEEEKRACRSRELAVSLYDKWVRERQRRSDIEPGDKVKNLKELEEIAKRNFETQLLEPRRKHLTDLKEVKNTVDFADQAALLALMELPALETSALLHRLGRQILAEPNAPYFGKENMADNCGSGCGCGCAMMRDLTMIDKLSLHHQAKPHSIDPFNELGTPQKVRDSLLAKDFLASFQAISEGVAGRINRRYFRMAEDFA